MVFGCICHRVMIFGVRVPVWDAKVPHLFDSKDPEEA
jgi:hypothetical protein